MMLHNRNKPIEIRLRETKSTDSIVHDIGEYFFAKGELFNTLLLD